MRSRNDVVMMHGWTGWLFVLAVLIVPVTSALAQPSDRDETRASEHDAAVIGMPIETGWVLVDGVLIDPPYIIAEQGQNLTINGRSIPALTQNQGGATGGPRRGDGREEGRRERRPQGDRDDQPRRRQRGAALIAARLEQQLIGGNLLVVSTDVGVALISRDSLPTFVEVMASDELPTDKALVLSRITQRPTRSALWMATIKGYQPDPRLTEAAEIILTQAEQRARERQAESAGVGWFTWVMPMAAIGAVLAGIGVLMHVHRRGLKESNSYRAWRNVDTTGRRARAVLLLIGLLVLLNGLDLTFTIVAQQTGQFAELSPIGDRLISKPMMLGMYKVAAVGLGVGLLLYLRQRRSAEVAAWWMCAVYVLVLARWAAVNTLIMA